MHIIIVTLLLYVCEQINTYIYVIMTVTKDIVTQKMNLYVVLDTCFIHKDVFTNPK